MLSQEQWLANLKLALKYWSKTPPDKVVKGLECYREPAINGCRTVACFGGHLVTWEPFKKMGVICTDCGTPAMRGSTGKFFGYLVAGYLFGDESLFHARGSDEPLHMTDHELVTWRIEQRIAELENQTSSV